MGPRTSPAKRPAQQQLQQPPPKVPPPPLLVPPPPPPPGSTNTIVASTVSAHATAPVPLPQDTPIHGSVGLALDSGGSGDTIVASTDSVHATAAIPLPPDTLPIHGSVGLALGSGSRGNSIHAMAPVPASVLAARAALSASETDPDPPPEPEWPPLDHVPQGLRPVVGPAYVLAAARRSGHELMVLLRQDFQDSSSCIFYCEVRLTSLQEGLFSPRHGGTPPMAVPIVGNFSMLPSAGHDPEVRGAYVSPRPVPEPESGAGGQPCTGVGSAEASTSSIESAADQAA